MEKIIPISDLQSKAKHYVEQVKKTEQPVIITQRGRAAAVLMSFEGYEGYTLTQSELREPDWERRLKRAHEEAHKGKSTELNHYLKTRKSKRPPTA